MPAGSVGGRNFGDEKKLREDGVSTVRRPMVVPWLKKRRSALQQRSWSNADRAAAFAARKISAALAPGLRPWRARRRRCSGHSARKHLVEYGHAHEHPVADLFEDA